MPECAIYYLDGAGTENVVYPPLNTVQGWHWGRDGCVWHYKRKPKKLKTAQACRRKKRKGGLLYFVANTCTQTHSVEFNYTHNTYVTREISTKVSPNNDIVGNSQALKVVSFTLCVYLWGSSRWELLSVSGYCHHTLYTQIPHSLQGRERKNGAMIRTPFPHEDASLIRTPWNGTPH